MVSLIGKGGPLLHKSKPQPQATGYQKALKIGEKLCRIVILGAGLSSTTLLSPFIRDHFVDSSGNRVKLDLSIAVYGLHTLNFLDIQLADGLICLFDATNENSFDSFKKMTEFLLRLRSKPLCVLRLYKNNHTFNTLDTHIISFCTDTLKCPSKVVSVSNNNQFFSILEHFYQFSLTTKRVQFVRAIKDIEINNYIIHKNEIFQLLSKGNDCFSQGYLFDKPFRFPSDHVVEHNTLDDGSIREITIPDTKLVSNKKEHYTCYNISIQTQFLQWTVSKRFKELLALSQKLKKMFPGETFAPFPPRTLFGSLSNTLILERRSKLELYLRSLVLNVDVVNSRELDTFLERPTVSNLDMTYNIDNKSQHEISDSQNIVQHDLSLDQSLPLSIAESVQLRHLRLLARANFDFIASEPNELTLKHEELLLVLASCQGWYYGMHFSMSEKRPFGNIGMFPANHASILNNEDLLFNGTSVNDALAYDYHYISKTLKPGDNKIYPQDSDYVSIEYVGKFLDGVMFCSSSAEDEVGSDSSCKFRLGQGEVLQVWDEAVQNMSVGQHVQLIVFPEEGYGDEGLDQLVPSNCTILFNITLLAIEDDELNENMTEYEDRKFVHSDSITAFQWEGTSMMGHPSSIPSLYSNDE